MPENAAYTIAVDGPGVTLSTVDPIEAMNVAIEYLRLLDRVTEHLGLDLKFSGLKAVPGSAGLQMIPTNPMAVAPVLALAEQLVSGEKYPPRELRKATKSAQAALRSLPQGLGGAAVVAFDAKAADILGRRFPQSVFVEIRDETGTPAGYYKYDALIVACAIRWNAPMVVALDRGVHALCERAGISHQYPAFFQSAPAQMLLPVAASPPPTI